MLHSKSKVCPYPFRYNADYRKVELQYQHKKDSDTEDESEKSSNESIFEETDEDCEMSSEPGRDRYGFMFFMLQID